MSSTRQPGQTYKGPGDLGWYNLRDNADFARFEREYAAYRAGTPAPVATSDYVAPAAAKGTNAPADPERKAQLAEALAYVASYTGTWGLPLDIRSDPRFGTKWMRLSDRQIEALLAGKARDAARIEAARLATELYADDEYSKHVASKAQAAPAPKAWRPAAKVEQDGMYQMPDGTIYKVQAAKVQGSGHLYAKRLVVEDGTGTFVYAPGAITRLDASMRMTLEQAKAYGKLYGVCCKCGSPLTDEVSIANGIGPVCAGKGWAD
jgi:hypothetical protein